MRKITPLECELLASFIKFPELVYCFSDLKQHHLNEFAWIIYDSYLTMELSKELSEFQIFLELRKRNWIDSEEYSFCVDGFGIADPFITSFSAENAYNQIKNIWNIVQLKEGLSRILNTCTTISEIKSGIKDLDIIEESSGETFIPVTSIPDDVDDDHVFKFGINSIDRATKVNRGDLIFIGARPSNGKTTLGIKIGMENTRYGLILFYSLEMGIKRIKWKCRSYGNYYKPENFMVKEGSSITIQDIQKSIRKLNPCLVVIDPLNKIDVGEKKEYDQFTKAARGLKVLAVTTGVPIVCLAQLNRENDKSKGRPYLHNFKSSGSIEEEGDICILIDVPDYSTCETNVYLEKNRTKYGHFAESKLKLDLATDQYVQV